MVMELQPQEFDMRQLAQKNRVMAVWTAVCGAGAILTALLQSV